MPQNILGTARGHITKNAERTSKFDRVYGGSELPPYTELTNLARSLHY